MSVRHFVQRGLRHVSRTMLFAEPDIPLEVPLQWANSTSIEWLTIFDEEASEPPFLPPATSDFVILLIYWVIFGWALRLCFLVCTLRDLAQAATSGRLSVHEAVPLHSLIGPLDLPVRLRFLGFLRSRTPDEPTAEIVAYSNPVELCSARLTLASTSGHSPSLAIELDCTLPATLQIFWGVSVNAAEVLEQTSSPCQSASTSSTDVPQAGSSRSSASRASKRNERTSRERTDVALGRSQSREISRTSRERADVARRGGAGATPTAASSASRCVSALRSRTASALGARRVVHEMEQAPRAQSIELGSSSTCSSCVGEAAETTGRAPYLAAPSHTLSSDGYRIASAPIAVVPGIRQTITLTAEQLPSAEALNPHSTLLDQPALLVFSNFGSPSRSSQSVSPQHSGATIASEAPGQPAAPASGKATKASAAASTLDVSMPVPPPGAADAAHVTTVDSVPVNSPAVLPSSALSPRRYAPAIAEEDVVLTVVPSVPSAPVRPPPMLPGMHQVVASCVAATVGFARPLRAHSSPSQPPLHSADDSATEEPPAAETEMGAAGSAPVVSEGSAGGRTSLPLTGVVQRVVMGTANGFLELADVFGLETEGEEGGQCVACMSEPKDTIVLPCRHLCVCSDCFDQLPTDRCPVCRTAFSSYLRIDVQSLPSTMQSSSPA